MGPKQWLAPLTEVNTMVKYGELHQALLPYTYKDIHDDIPVDYYRRVMKAWFRANNAGLSWDVQQAASILLFLAFNEGKLSPSQLNSNGLKTLDWAEKFLDQIDERDEKEVIRALSAA
jgi:hypothetical protein